MPIFCQRIQPRLGRGQYGSYGLPCLLIFMYFGVYTSYTALAAAPCTDQVKRSSKRQNETKLKTEFLVGKRLKKVLQGQIDQVTWQNIPLRKAIYRLSVDRGCALIMDRRIDPSVLISHRAQRQSRLSLLSVLARSQSASFTTFEDWMYIGPQTQANSLAELMKHQRQMLRNLPKPMQQRYRRSTTLQWPDLQSPQAILDNISQNYRFEIYGSEQVPWDLWAHATIPQTSVIEQLTLVLIQFDLTFQWQNEGSEVHLVPITRDDYAQLQQEVRIPSARAQPLHNPGASRGKKKVLTFRVKNKPLAEVLDVLENATPYTWFIDWAALEKQQIDRQQLVSVQVRQASLSEVLRRLLKPLGVSFRMRDGQIRIPAATAR